MQSPAGVRVRTLFLPFLLAAACTLPEPEADSAGEESTATAAAAAAPEFPATNRPDVMGPEAAVSSDHPLASAAGIDVLRRGGNAIDAAVTMAAVLAVVRPHMNGVGGDAFALIHPAGTDDVIAMNGSGRAGALATPEFFTAAGDDEIPSRGARSVTVPGAVGAWAEALERFGTISLADALAPAIRYAEEGFPVTHRLHDDIADGADVLNDAARAIYLQEGEPPAPGTLLRNPPLAATLRRIAEQGPAAMYGGRIGERIATFLEAEGGHLRVADFAAHTTTWTEPLSTEYMGLRVFALPPNTQGVTLLEQLRMASAMADLAEQMHNGAGYLHRMIEIKRLAFADRDRWIADPEFVDVPVSRMLDPAYAAERVATIQPGRAADSVSSGIGPSVATPETDAPDDGDTVYLTAVDSQGNAVSWIQSLFASFGSGLMEPETGVVLQNRGALYTLDPEHPQIVAPGKRPFHTLTPHMAFEGDRLALTFGTPGGDGQTQTLLQVLNNLFLFGMSPQEAVEAPRYRSESGTLVLLEDRIPSDTREALTAMGYRVRTISGWTATFGGAQVIRIHPESGARIVASDPRREAYGIAF